MLRAYSFRCCKQSSACCCCCYWFCPCCVSSYPPSIVGCVGILHIELLLMGRIRLTINSSGWLWTLANFHNSLIMKKFPQARCGESTMNLTLSAINILTSIGSWIRICIWAWHFLIMKSNWLEEDCNVCTIKDAHALGIRHIHNHKVPLSSKVIELFQHRLNKRCPDPLG